MPPKKFSPDWKRVSLHVTIVHSCDYSLALILSASPTGKQFGVGAVEGAMGGSTQTLLDNHAYALIGEKFRSLAAAKRAAEKFARKWTKAVESSLVGGVAVKCDCPEIVMNATVSPTAFDPMKAN